MTSDSLNNLENCRHCGAELNESMPRCPTCQADAGFPNVRIARKPSYKKQLEERYKKAKQKVTDKGDGEKFGEFVHALQTKSGVVLAMPAGVARAFFSDKKELYAGYEALVKAQARKPAPLNDDRRRCGVVGILFGSFAEHIIYGALSLTDKGLSSYGDVFCRLKDIAIEKRTSFLETNSYKFVQEHNMEPGTPIPLGYISDWADRFKLAVAKLAESTETVYNESEWQDLILYSDGNRENDEFIEAHIYGTFDSNAIGTIALAENADLRREDRIDWKIALENFKKRGK